VDIVIPSIPDCLSQAPTWSELLAKFNGHDRLLRDVLAMMGREAPQLGRNFRKAVEVGNSREARRAAHTLKSNCRQFDLHSFSHFAEILENLAQTQSCQSLQRYVPAVEEIGYGVADWCEALLQSHAQEP